MQAVQHAGLLLDNTAAEAKPAEARRSNVESSHFSQLSSPSERIQALVDALLANQIGPPMIHKFAPSCAEMTTWIISHFQRWKVRNPNFQELQRALGTETTLNISIEYTGDKEETIEKIHRLAGLLYLLHQENVLACKKITITLPNSEFSTRRKLLGTIAQVANLAFGALLTWLMMTQVPSNMMPNDSPWTAENSWFRNLLPPAGMGLMFASATIFSLPSYINTCPNRDRLGFMAAIQQDERLRFLTQRGIEISYLFSKQLIKRPKCTFRWQ